MPTRAFLSFLALVAPTSKENFCSFLLLDFNAPEVVLLEKHFNEAVQPL